MNIYDVTAEAETFISTVSRVLNNKGDVSPKIRDRVEVVLKKYDHKPSVTVRDMAFKTMKNIAILTVDVRVTHYAGMIYVIKQEFSNLGYNVFACNIGGSIQECNWCSEILSEEQTDGIAPIGSVSSELIMYSEITAKVKDTSIIIANGQVKLPNFYSVLVDDTKAIRIVSDYVFDHEHMGLFYVFDIAMDSGRVERQSSLEATKLRDVPNGNDRAPEDIVIINCSNSPDSGICEPELAILDNKPELLGGMCAFLLRDGMEGEESATGVAIQPELVIRGSASF